MVRLEWSEKIEVSTTGSKSRKGSKGKDEKSANTESTVKNQKAQSKKISLKNSPVRAGGRLVMFRGQG